MDWQSLTTLGLPILGICALLCVYALYAFRKARKEVPPASNEVPTDRNARFNVLGYVFFGLGAICWIGFSLWAIVAFEMTARNKAPSVIMVVAVLVALVFYAIYFALKSLGVKFLKEPK